VPAQADRMHSPAGPRRSPQEDIAKVDGDDPRRCRPVWIGLRGRIAGVGPAFVPSRAGQAPPFHSQSSTPHFVTGMPLGEQIARVSGERYRSNFAPRFSTAPRS